MFPVFCLKQEVIEVQVGQIRLNSSWARATLQRVPEP